MFWSARSQRHRARPLQNRRQAQRRRRGAVLQHGSLLLERSEFAPMYAGLFDLLGMELPITDSIPALAERIARQLTDNAACRWDEAIPLEILEEGKRLEREKYLKPNWR